MITQKQNAPDFTLPQDGGEDITLSSLSPRSAVLFFYPRDNTPGCTSEAKAFSALTQDFAALGITVIGVSKDSLESHAKFRAKHDLQVILLSDEHGTTCEDYGVWKEKSMYGKTYLGIERSTFLIDGTGRIAQVWNKVSAKGHADEVLAAAKALHG